VGFGSADPQRRGLWLGLLLDRLATLSPRPLRLPRLHEEELPFEVLLARGFAAAERTLGYAADARAG
jgi:hypothetical protein